MSPSVHIIRCRARCAMLWVFPVVAVFVAVALITATPAAAWAQGSVVRAANDMARIPGGTYSPFVGGGSTHTVRVATFRLDRHAVTRGEFLAFVRRHAAWRRDRVRPDSADGGYLRDWPAALDAGGAADLARPVTSVSWFAARAYCVAEDRRLPTVDEWEYAAAASETVRDATHDPAFTQRLLQLYATDAVTRGRAGRGFRNAYGVDGMHGGPWEWTEDFDNALIAHDPRAGGVGTGHSDISTCAAAAIGAADPANYAAFLRYAIRAALNTRSTVSLLGFRCAA